MTKQKFLGLALAVFIGGMGLGLLRAQTTVAQTMRVEDLTVRTAAGDHAFKVEIADTPASQHQGLMFRTSMPPDHGMLFELNAKIPPVTYFWMKDTKMPLDMLFIDPHGAIVGIVKNAAPESTSPLGPNLPSAAVLEINGGLSDQLGIKEKDRVVHPFFH